MFSQGRPQNVEYTAVVFPGPKDNVIFNAATIWWSDGLSAPPGYIHPSAHGAKPQGPDPRIQRITGVSCAGILLGRSAIERAGVTVSATTSEAMTAVT